MKIRVLTSSAMREVERRAIEDMGVPSLLLMENAAGAIAGEISRRSQSMGEGPVAVLCGPGNNGGDGLACARLIIAGGLRVHILFIGDVERQTADNRTNYNIALKLGVPLTHIRCPGDLGMAADIIGNCPVLLDALLGTGINKPVEGLLAAVIDLINNSGKFVVCADIPSGLHADTGCVMKKAVRGSLTVVLSSYKLGNLVGDAKDYSGELVVGNIGIPGDMSLENFRGGPDAFTYDAAGIGRLFLRRKARSNKGTYGSVFVIGGSAEMPGALTLAGLGAYKGGCGLVCLCSVEGAVKTAQGCLREAVTAVLSEEAGFISSGALARTADLLSRGGCAVVGPGMGNHKATAQFLEGMIKEDTLGLPAVLDADALNIIAGNRALLDILGSQGFRRVLTPHPGEMARLLNMSTADVLADIPGCCRKLAMAYNIIVLLKDAATVVSDEKGHLYINTTGGPYLSKGGSGDVLAGIIASFIAQGMDAFDAACAGAYIHGAAGGAAALQIGSRGVLASETANYVPGIIDSLLEMAPADWESRGE